MGTNNEPMHSEPQMPQIRAIDTGYGYTFFPAVKNKGEFQRFIGFFFTAGPPGKPFLFIECINESDYFHNIPARPKIQNKYL